jgi:hypothetical protein
VLLGWRVCRWYWKLVGHLGAAALARFLRQLGREVADYARDIRR